MEVSRDPRAAGRVLIVDDEESIRDSIRDFLSDEGFTCDARGSGEEALEALAHEEYVLVLTDLRMPGIDGIELIRRGREVTPSTLFVVLTAFGTLDTAIDAMRLGAIDYLQKPIAFEDLLLRVRRVLVHRELLLENARLHRILSRRLEPAGLIGESGALRGVRELVERYAPLDLPVLVTGESGTGKELVARALHATSAHASGPFLAVNCAALPETLLESELFGWKRGAFTGADRDREGLMLLAGRGTLFLDEVAELAVGTQAKLLRALETREVMPLGGSRSVKVEARLITATNRDLDARMKAGEFREDLYFRLNVLEIRIPALRERREDIPALVSHFIEKHRLELRSAASGADRDAIDLLLRQPWKGNVRELENVIQRALILARGETLTARDLPADLLAVSEGPIVGWSGEPLREAVRSFERRIVQQAIDLAGGDKGEAARRLEISLASLYVKLKENTD